MRTAVLFLTAFLLIAATPSPSQSLSFAPFFRFQRLLSLSRSLLHSVADLRANRGDVSGAQRVRALSQKLDGGLGLGFWRMALGAAWDYAWNWRSLPLAPAELYGAVSDLNELMTGLSELTRLESAAERSAWVARNYQNVFTVSKSLSAKLLKAFSESGVLREVVETVQKEVVEGGLIRDCLELGSKDFSSLIQLLKDSLLQFFPLSDRNPEL
ncbi:hypothetical protein HN51_062440 [Arachis hypogaea]|uniref:Uncharacterized protein n=1 Tax=Arachis hypogaea TaxID=3818 RepID=A0A445AST4_ARAHY|nr:uncharacterized protein LOC107618055 [Arachis ipaensis]XP_025628142.1 uncharacterized protein LOC112721287 [Arachis hypogaea]RYR29480.1 hypothetical protein Ahy_B01g053883 [Arachis hypogaea]